MNIKLKAGQKVRDSKGNVYLTEANDVVKVKENLRGGTKEQSVILEDKKGELYIIYSDFGDIQGTPYDNYKARITNERLIQSYSAFSSVQDVADYLIKHNGMTFFKTVNESIKIKEAGQLTFNGEVEDEFYDANKVYKTIYKYLEDKLGKRIDKYNRKLNLKNLAEEFYDYIIANYGEPLKDESLFDFIENLFTESDFLDDFWYPKVLTPIGDGLVEEVKELEIRYDGDYLLDAINPYVGKEDHFEWGQATYDIEDVNEEQSLPKVISTHDLYEWIKDNEKALDHKHLFTVEKTDGYHLDDEFIATASFDFGEEKADVPEWFEEFAKENKSSDDMQWLENYVADNSYGGLSDRGEPYVNYDPYIFNICLKWDDIKKSFLDDMDKKYND